MSQENSHEAEREAYLEKMKEERGYLLDFHKVLAEEDFDFLKGYNALLEAAYTNQRSIDPKTKEMVFIAVLMAVRSQPDHIKTHMEMAKQYGVTKQEMLEVMEMAMPPSGVPAFMNIYPVWRQVYGV